MLGDIRPNESENKLTAAFIKQAGQVAPLDIFKNSLQRKFRSEDTVNRVIQTLNALQLPIPEQPDEYVIGTEGHLIFSNQHGVVIRIERKEPNFRDNIHRINNNPWIIQPLGTFSAGEAIIEICPGCHCVDKGSFVLRHYLKETGIHFWDLSLDNTGILPFKTPSFPEGVPVVIDRLSVSGLSKDTAKIKKALDKIGTPQDPQKVLYGSLRSALKESWPSPEQAPPNPSKMKLFWQMCQEKVKEGTLVAGWNASRASDKTAEARISAKLYDATIINASKAGNPCQI